MVSGLLQKKTQKKGRVRSCRNVFSSFIVSYVVVLLVPLFCSLIILFNIQRSLKAELAKTNNAILTQTRQTIENVIDNVTGLCLDLSIKDSTSSLLYIRPPFTSQQQYNIGYAIRTDMKTSNAVRQFVDNYMIYFGNGNFLLTPSAKHETLLGFDQYFEGSSLTYEEWKKILKKVHFKRVIDIGNNLMYCQTIPYTSREPVANILVLIDKSKLIKQLNNIEWVQNGKFFLLDENGAIILTNSSEEYFAQLSLPDLQENSQTGSYNGKEVLFSAQTSENGWRYLLVMDNTYLNSSLQGFNSMFVYYIFAAVTMGIWLAILFSRKNYMPIKNVVTTLKKNELAPESGNELAFIDFSVRKIINLNADMQHQLELKDEQVRQNYLSRLLRGRMNISSIDDTRLFQNFLKFEYNNLLLVLFRIDNYIEYFADMNIHEEYPLDSMDYSLIYLIRELVCQKYIGYVCEVSGFIACVINFSDGDKEEDVIETIRYTQKFVEQGLYISMTAAVSNLHKSKMGIQKAYEEATIAMENSIFNDSRILFYSQTESVSEYSYSSDLENALSSSLRSGNNKEAKEILDEVFRAYLSKKNISMDLFRCFAYDIAATFIRVLESMNLQSDTLCAARISSRISSFDSADKMQQFLLSTVEEICTLVNLGKESHNTVLLNNIFAYLHHNFANFNLSNTLISEAMDISPAYLSRFFKQQTGEGILGYINRIRIEEAKKRMVESKYATLADICAEIGFENSATFIRIFKKQEGITPGKYIEMLNEKKQIQQ